jgi:twinkle protein
VVTVKDWSDYGLSVPSGSGEIDIPCPRCSAARKKKSARCLSVNRDKGMWICHHCGFAGSLEHGEAGVDPGWRRPKYRPPPEREISLDLPPTIVTWFAKRAISPAVLKRNQIGYAQVYMPQLEEKVGSIVFPYLRDGVVVNRKFRDHQKDFRMEGGAERIFYGLDDITTERVIVVEGEIDKLSVEECGLYSCVSVPDGAPPPGARDYASKFDYLDSAAAKLDPVKTFVLAVDADEPGQRLEDELARRFGPERCARVRWPEGVKDANEMLQKHGKEDLRYLLEHAERLPIEGVIEATQLFDGIADLYRHGFKPGASTGWREMDRNYTVRPGDTTVITGLPGAGKSTWLDNLLVNLAKLHGWRFGIFSPENEPTEEHAAAMAEKYLRMPFSAGRGALRMTEADLARALDWIGEHFYWICPSDEDTTPKKILEAADQLVKRVGIHGLVIDPWNEVEPSRTHGMTESEFISQTLRQIRRFGQQRGIHTWIVAHPTKLQRDKTGRYPTPTLYDISGSAAFRNRCDCGIVVDRDLTDKDSPETQICVQKIRRRHVGRRGVVTLYYEQSCATYSDREPTIGTETRLDPQFDS